MIDRVWDRNGDEMCRGRDRCSRQSWVAAELIHRLRVACAEESSDRFMSIERVAHRACDRNAQQLNTFRERSHACASNLRNKWKQNTNKIERGCSRGFQGEIIHAKTAARSAAASSVVRSPKKDGQLALPVPPFR
jgi:hypothetical protein